MSATLCPSALYAHTRDDIDFAALAGKRVAVLGCGRIGLRQRGPGTRAAARARCMLYFRRARAGRTSTPIAGPSSWASSSTSATCPTPTSGASSARSCAWASCRPPTPSARARAHPGFHLHAGCAWRRSRRDGDASRSDTERRHPRGRLRDRRHRLRHRPLAAPRARRARAAHRALGGPLSRRPPASEHADLAAASLPGPRLRAHREGARRGALAAPRSSTTPSAGCSASALAARASRA